MTVRTAYVIVAVDVDDNGAVESMYVDHDGAPYMYSDSEPNVWDGDAWISSDDDDSGTAAWCAAADAITAAVLAYAGTVVQS